MAGRHQTEIQLRRAKFELRYFDSTHVVWIRYALKYPP